MSKSSIFFSHDESLSVFCTSSKSRPGRLGIHIEYKLSSMSTHRKRNNRHLGSFEGPLGNPICPRPRDHCGRPGMNPLGESNRHKNSTWDRPRFVTVANLFLIPNIISSICIGCLVREYNNPVCRAHFIFWEVYWSQENKLALHVLFSMCIHVFLLIVFQRTSSISPCYRCLSVAFLVAQRQNSSFPLDMSFHGALMTSLVLKCCNMFCNIALLQFMSRVPWRN